MTTRWQVEKAVLASKLEPQPRLIVLALCVKAVAATAVIPEEHTPSLVEIADITGLAKSTVSEWMKPLDAAGWVIREQPTGDSKTTRISYALGVGESSVARPKRASRAKKKAAEGSLSGPSDGVSEDNEKPQSDTESAANGPLSESSDGPPSEPERSAERYEDGPPSGTSTVRSANDSGPLSGPSPSYDLSKTKTDQAERPESPHVPAQRTSPPVRPRWLEGNLQTSPTVVGENRTGNSSSRRSGLFPLADIKLTEREQIIFDWLRWNDYPEATQQDAREIDKILRREFAGKGPAYLRGMAKPEGSGFGGWYQQIRRDRAEVVNEQIRAMEVTEPPCEHGSLAGRSLHPTHGTFLCAACRAGAPVRDDGPVTHPDVVAALDAYHAVRGGPIDAANLINLTQQTEALRAAGVTGDQLTTLAQVAAAAGVGLIAAAARKDT